MIDESKQLTVLSEKKLSNDEFKKTHQSLAKFVKNQLREAKDIKNGDSGDYGVIPYTNKLSLLKPGAEKLLILHGYTAKYELVKEVEDFANNFVLYKYRCIITHAASGTFIADAVRSCNNKEKKHASKTVYDAANTIESVAQKRALVAATVQATMASEIFDADISETETQAPNKPVTENENPRRIRLMGQLYGVADDHGWTNAWIHKAIEKKWGVDSLTKISDEQIEELTEFILEKYIKVSKGESPKLKSDRYEAQVINNEENNDKTVYRCKGKTHVDIPENERPIVPIGEFCSQECRDSYYPPKNKPVTDYTFGKKKKTDPASEAAAASI